MEIKFWLDLIIGAYESGYKKALECTGKLPAYLSLNKAQKIYGRKRVNYWIESKLITPIKVTGKRNGELKLLRERLELLNGLSCVQIKFSIIPPEKLPE